MPEELASYAKIEHIRITEQDLIQSAGQEIIANAKKQVRGHDAGECEAVLESGDPASKIAEIAESKDADLIVMGRRGLGDLSGLLFGSVSHKVAQAVDCCCLTVK